MRFRKQLRGASDQSSGLDTDSAFSDDASSMLSGSESSTSSASVNGQSQLPPTSNVVSGPAVAVSKKVILDIYCADGSTKESILVDSSMTVGGALKLMAEKSCVDCHVKWGLVERLPELFIDRCLEDDEKLLRIISTWKPQTSNRLIFAQRPEKYDLFRRPERYLLDPYDKASTESVMQSPWDTNTRQALVQRVMDSVNQASTTLLEGPLWLKTEGKKWKKFHFILRDYNLFQTTRSKKGSVHDVHFVASLATVKVYNGIGWKKRYKAPTDFCFALKPPEVQEKKAHIRYLCAENEFIKWGWYSMLRLTLGPPQQLVDNYNAQLGVAPPIAPGMQNAKQVEQGDRLIRSASITSNGDCSMSSGCVSENDENGFDIDYPDGGTIKRKPNTQVGVGIIGGQVVSHHPDHLPLPPPPPLGPQQQLAAGEMTPTEMNSLPLPPPPMETTMVQVEVENENGQQSTVEAIREELYPCGVMRTLFQKIDDELPNDLNQMSLLQQLPSQPPPLPASLMMQAGQHRKPENANPSSMAAADHRPPRGKVTFSEYVHDLDNCQWEPLKGRPPVEESNAANATGVDSNCQRTTEQISYKEKDVSEWVLDSLRHCSSPTGQQPASVASASAVQSNNSSSPDAMRPKLYNGRTVPNCFSPEEVQLRLQHDLSSTPSSSRKLPPPPPPRNGTYLSH